MVRMLSVTAIDNGLVAASFHRSVRHGHDDLKQTKVADFPACPAASPFCIIAANQKVLGPIR